MITKYSIRGGKMKLKRNYYLIIPARDIFIKLYKKDIIIVDGGKAETIFDEYGIPKRMQKLVLEVSINNVMNPYEAFELTTKEMFRFKTSFIKTILSQKANDRFELLSKNVAIITDNKCYHSQVVKDFYQKIIDMNLADDYVSAIYEILGKSRIKNNNLFIKKRNTN